MVRSILSVKAIMTENVSLYKDLHARDPKFGGRGDAGGLTSNLSKAILKLEGFETKSVLDFGTGKGNLVKSLRQQLDTSKYRIDGYDPAVQEWDQKPNERYDIVTCIDVLEHLERSNIDQFLADLKKYVEKFCFLLIDLQPAVQHLSNGRNAHTLLAPLDWWSSKISQYFPATIGFPIMHQGGYVQKYIVTATNKPKYISEMMIFTNSLNIFERSMVNPIRKS